MVVVSLTVSVGLPHGSLVAISRALGAESIWSRTSPKPLQLVSLDSLCFSLACGLHCHRQADLNGHVSYLCVQ